MSTPQTGFWLPVQDLLVDTKEVVADAQWGQLRTIIGRVKGAPNNARDNLDSVIALFDDARAAEK